MNILIRSMSSRAMRSEEHTSELQSLTNLVCRLLLEKKRGPITPSLMPVTETIVFDDRAAARPPRRDCPALRFGSSTGRPPASTLAGRIFFFKEGPPTEISPFPLPAAFPL